MSENVIAIVFYTVENIIEKTYENLYASMNQTFDGIEKSVKEIYNKYQKNPNLKIINMNIFVGEYIDFEIEEVITKRVTNVKIKR